MTQRAIVARVVMLKIDCSFLSQDWCKEFGSESSLISLTDSVLKKTIDFLPFTLPAGSELSVQFSDASRVCILNAKWRGIDKPTNVLSFASNDGVALIDWSPLLGDIVLSYETISEESRMQSKVLESHLCHLLVHGFLHLLGYDHDDSSKASEMEHLETTILASLSIADPYN